MVKEKIKSLPATARIFNQFFIEINRPLTGYQRLILMSSASISSAVVMIFDDAE